MSAHMLDPFRKLRSFRKWDKGMDNYPENHRAYTIQSHRPFKRMWRMNTVPNINVCWSIHLQAYLAAISLPLQWFQDPVNHPLINRICPVMMKNAWRITMWLQQHPHEAIAQHAYWQPPGSIWLHCLKPQRTGCIIIQISMITTRTQWRLAVHLGYAPLTTGGANRRNRTESTLISQIWCMT